MGMNPEMIVMLTYEKQLETFRRSRSAPRHLRRAGVSLCGTTRGGPRIVYLMSCVSLSDDGAVHVPRSYFPMVDVGVDLAPFGG